jgi:hypothetical protein
VLLSVTVEELLERLCSDPCLSFEEAAIGVVLDADQDDDEEPLPPYDSPYPAGFGEFRHGVTPRKPAE